MESLPSRLMKKSLTSASPSQVWMAIQIWHDKPHVINRHLSGAATIFSRKLNRSLSFNDLYRLIIDTKISKSMTDEEIKLIFSRMEIYNSDESDEFGMCLTVRKLLPRSNKHHLAIFEITLLDKLTYKSTFFDLYPEEGDEHMVLRTQYTFQFERNEIQLLAHGLEENVDFSWLMNHVFPKIQKWAELALDQNIPSLSLVSVDQYTSLYQELKKKYGQHMVEIWPESTDPSKFVYEDVAIATYLLLLWEHQREERKQPDLKQTFVDLGCGNGLLVHILASEGHKGIGIDVRKRKIWDCYPSTTVLKVQTITPSDDFLFPDTDWIIGNHSDELTPWIPVIAARSSYNCSFFVLPCCCFDFSGSKYQRNLANQSIYAEYLDYIQHICEVCGFESQRDKLRIPSTKRICIVGSKRKHAIDDNAMVEKNISNLLNERCSGVKRSHSISDPDSGVWVTEFMPRQKEEITRNCTKLDKDIVNKVVDIVASLILRDYKKGEGPSGFWNTGEAIPLNEVADAIPKELLKEMKSECGGLQTLLKNNHQIFDVAKGKVQFRTPASTKMVESNRQTKQGKKLKIKVKPCWFFHNHPDGCPLDDKECSYQH